MSYKALAEEKEFSAEDAGMDVIDSSDSNPYILVHTLGAATVNPLNGDGAYAEWLQRYFENNISVERCVMVDRLAVERMSNLSDRLLAGRLNRKFYQQFGTILQTAVESGIEANVVILNWHVRFTGRANAQSGRGMSLALFKGLQKIASEYGKQLKIVYTIHEFTESIVSLIAPSALIALNPAVEKQLRRFCSEIPIFLSRVPSLMSSAPTRSVDLISDMIGISTDSDSLRSKYYSTAAVLQTLKAKSFEVQRSLHLTDPSGFPALTDRLQTFQTSTVSDVQGIIIFGSITGRHGTTEENIRLLHAYLDRGHVPDAFKIVIAGFASDRHLASVFREMGLSTEALQHRVHYGVHNDGSSSEINSFDELPRVRYAISFDVLGFRDNASAMVNALRAGHVLFSRDDGESDEELIRRAVMEIILCERNSGHYAKLLSAQQQRFMGTSPNLIGADLDRFFARFAGSGSSVQFSDERIEMMLVLVQSILSVNPELESYLQETISGIAERLSANPRDEEAQTMLVSIARSINIEELGEELGRGDAAGFDYHAYMPFPSDEQGLFLAQAAFADHQIIDVSPSENNCLIHTLVRLTTGITDDVLLEDAGRRIRLQLIAEGRTVHGALLQTYFHGRRILELIPSELGHAINPDDYTVTEHWTYNGIVQMPDSIGHGATQLHIWNSGGHYQCIEPRRDGDIAAPRVPIPRSPMAVAPPASRPPIPRLMRSYSDGYRPLPRRTPGSEYRRGSGSPPNKYRRM